MSFDHLKTIYRDFDIRGKFPEEITTEEVYKIGKAVVLYFNAKKIATISRSNWQNPSGNLNVFALFDQQFLQIL